MPWWSSVQIGELVKNSDSWTLSHNSWVKAPVVGAESLALVKSSWMGQTISHAGTHDTGHRRRGTDDVRVAQVMRGAVTSYLCKWECRVQLGPKSPLIKSLELTLPLSPLLFMQLEPSAEGSRSLGLLASHTASLSLTWCLSFLEWRWFLRTAHLSGCVNSMSVSLNRKTLGNLSPG